MKDNTEALKKWAINKIKKEYPEDVALLLAVPGHTTDGDGHGLCFDYYIPATERAYELGQTFILDGIGHDLYPRSWKRTEATANLEDGPSRCIATAEILYSRSKEDEERFLAIQRQFNKNLSNEAFMYEKGLEQIETAMSLYSTLLFQDKLYKARVIAGYAVNYLSKAIAYLNGTYLDKFSDEELSAFTKIPEGFLDGQKALLDAENAEQLRNAVYPLILMVRNYYENLKKNDNEKVPNEKFADLADWYQELSLTMRRLRYYCDNKDAQKVYTESCCLQSELNIVQDEYNLQEMDLFSSFHPMELDAIKKQCNKIEQYIREQITNAGIKIKEYESIEEFLANN